LPPSEVAIPNRNPSICPKPVRDLDLHVAPPSVEVSIQFSVFAPNAWIPTYRVFPAALIMGFQASGMAVEIIFVERVFPLSELDMNQITLLAPLVSHAA
jgi:hypothetical protein